MKRPLATFTLIYFTVLAAAVCLISPVNLTLSIMVTVLGLVAIFFRSEWKRVTIIVLIPISLGFAVMSYEQTKIAAVSASLGTQTCTISGEITEIPRRQYGRWYYVVKTDSIGISGAPQSIKLRLTCRNSLEAREGDRVTATVTFIRNDNETGYDSETSLLADGIQARAWCSPYTEHLVTKGRAGLKYLPLTLRRHIISAIRKALPEKSAGMLCAMLLGDTDYLDDDIADNFRTTGIAHLLAVSGLHMSLLTYALSNLLRKLKFSPRLNTAVTIAFIVLFMAVTGFSPSVTRAGFMHLMALTSGLLLRDTDSLTSMSIGVLVMLLVNPMSAADIGLQLSVCSTFALICFSNKVKQYLKDWLTKINAKVKFQCRPRFVHRLKTYLIESLAASLTAALATLPLSAVHFGRISLIAPLTNLLCVYAATLFIIIGIIAALLHVIPLLGLLIAFPFQFAAAVLCEYLALVTRLLAKFPLASANADYPYVPYFLAFAAAAALAAFLMARQVNTPAFRQYARCFSFFGISFLLLVSMLSYQLAATGAEMIVFGMQDGGVCVLAKNGSRAMIAEAGGDSYDLHTIKDVLSENGIQRIDALTVSKKSDLRSSIADGIIEAYAPDYFFCAGDISQYPFAQKAAEQSHSEILPFGGAITVKSSALSLKMYTDSAGDNWQRLQCGNLTVLVCPDGGDCALLPPEYRHCDAAVIGTQPKNITYLSTGAVILTAEFSQASQIAYRLHVKGFRHLYFTSLDGTLTCAAAGGNLLIQKS